MFTFEMLYPKPEPLKRTRRRNRRQEAAMIRAVRQIVEDRDGYCKFGNDFRTCRGESQWAHFGEYRRFKTRGKPPEERHTTFGSLMLCQFHHDAYDGRDGQWTLEITPMTDRGCDGPIKFDMRER